MYLVYLLPGKRSLNLFWIYSSGFSDYNCKVSRDYNGILFFPHTCTCVYTYRNIGVLTQKQLFKIFTKKVTFLRILIKKKKYNSKCNADKKHFILNQRKLVFCCWSFYDQVTEIFNCWLFLIQVLYCVNSFLAWPTPLACS